MILDIMEDVGSGSGVHSGLAASVERYFLEFSETDFEHF